MTDDDRTKTAVGDGSPDTVEAAIVQAARELLAEGGVKALTMEGVARRAAVAKTTIYRRWRSKEELALHVVLEMTNAVVSTPAAADTRSSLVELLDGAVTILRTTLMGQVMRGLASDLATDRSLGRAYQDRVVTLRKSRLADLVQRGVSLGELSPDCDVDLLHDLLFGPVYYRLLMGDGAFAADSASRIVDAVLPAFAARPATEQDRPPRP